MFVLDPESPVPLYHQLVETIRYRIATGQLRPGDRLPPVRQAATSWRIHMHTVRHAYRELAKLGLVAAHRAKGTVVLDSHRSATESALRLPVLEEIRRFAENMQGKHGLSPSRLAELIRSTAHLATHQPNITVIECNPRQAEDYARQLERAWSVAATPWCLDGEEPPSGPLLSTYFHYNDARARWAERVDDLYFVSVQPDPELPDLLKRSAAEGGPMQVTIAEIDQARADNILPDLLKLLPQGRFFVSSTIFKSAAEGVRAASQGPVLFAPRLWARLSDDQRARPNVYELRYVLNAVDLRAVATELGWRPVNARMSRA